MKRTLKFIALAMALLYTGSLAAQEQNSTKLFEKYNWFVSGALNGEWLFNTTGNMYLGGKVGGVFIWIVSLPYAQTYLPERIA